MALDVNSSRKLFIKSQIMDYTLCGEVLSSFNVIDFLVNTYEADIANTSCQQEKDNDLATDDQTNLMQGSKWRWGRPLNECIRYLKSHPKYKSKYCIMWDRKHNTLPNFIRRYFPSRNDDDQRSFYYASMLTLLK